MRGDAVCEANALMGVNCVELLRLSPNYVLKICRDKNNLLSLFRVSSQPQFALEGCEIKITMDLCHGSVATSGGNNEPNKSLHPDSTI